MTRTPASSLADVWRAGGREWLGYSDSHADAVYWRMNLPMFLDFVGPPGDGMTVDLGCGDGMLDLGLADAGHRLIGVDISPEIAEAARRTGVFQEVITADAVDVPLPDGCATTVIAFMSLHAMVEFERAIAEAARLLVPGGVFYLAINHPIKTACEVLGCPNPAKCTIDNCDHIAQSTIVDSYFECRDRVVHARFEDGSTMVFHGSHRPLAAYFAALTGAGFLVHRLMEPIPDAEVIAQRPVAERYLRIPTFLYIEARLPEVTR